MLVGGGPTCARPIRPRGRAGTGPTEAPAFGRPAMGHRSLPQGVGSGGGGRSAAPVYMVAARLPTRPAQGDEGAGATGLRRQSEGARRVASASGRGGCGRTPRTIEPGAVGHGGGASGKPPFVRDHRFRGSGVPWARGHGPPWAPDGRPCRCRDATSAEACASGLKPGAGCGVSVPHRAVRGVSSPVPSPGPSGLACDPFWNGRESSAPSRNVTTGRPGLAAGTPSPTDASGIWPRVGFVRWTVRAVRQEGGFTWLTGLRGAASLQRASCRS